MQTGNVAGGAIYLMHGAGQPVELREDGYESEDLLQHLIANHPHLLAGEQIDATSARRWLLIAREVKLAADESGTGRWSIDHLFIDQDAIPTVIETKRGSDTRIRREIVGQMLDYAANAVIYWPVEDLRAQFETSCTARGDDPREAITQLLAGEADEERFWEQVRLNLQAGRLRLIFVSDSIPIELRRVVEFLDAQFRLTRVAAVEVKQYVGEGMQALVPRVVAQAVQPSTGGITVRGEQWTEKEFFKRLAERQSTSVVEVARQIIDWAHRRGFKVDGGRGRQDGSLNVGVQRERDTHWTLSLWTYGRMEIGFERLKVRPPFAAEVNRRELLERLNRVPGIVIPPDGITKRPSLPLTDLVLPDTLRQFFAAIDWAAELIEQN